MVCSRYPLDEVFTIFNTSVPQGHPGNMRQFRLPPEYPGRGVWVYFDHDRSSGTVNRDGHLIIDPTQAIFIMSLSTSPQGSEVILILRIQSLIEHACSIRTDAKIPWDEWGRGVVVMENPTGYVHSTTIVHGPRMLVLRSTRERRKPHYRIHTFDFSRRGSAALPLSDGGDGATGRRATFEGGQNCVFEVGGGMNVQDIESLGDSMVVHIVSLLSSHWRGQCGLIYWLGAAIRRSVSCLAYFGHDVKRLSHRKRPSFSRSFGVCVIVRSDTTQSGRDRCGLLVM